MLILKKVKIRAIKILDRVKAVVPIKKWAPLNKNRLGWSLSQRVRAKKG